MKRQFHAMLLLRRTEIIFPDHNLNEVKIYFWCTSLCLCLSVFQSKSLVFCSRLLTGSCSSAHSHWDNLDCFYFTQLSAHLSMFQLSSETNKPFIWIAFQSLFLDRMNLSSVPVFFPTAFWGILDEKHKWQLNPRDLTMSDKTHPLSSHFPCWASFPSISLPICRHSVTVSKFSALELELSSGPSGRSWPWLNVGHGQMQGQGPELKQSPQMEDGPVDISPGSHGSSHFILTLGLGHHPASPSCIFILGHRQANPQGVGF